MAMHTKGKEKPLQVEKTDSSLGSRKRTIVTRLPVRGTNELNAEILSCKLCRLSESRIRAVPGEGKDNSPEIMIVGEAPGRNEDKTGRPFVGAGGKLLDSLLEKTGLAREDVFITNIVKCRPPKNRRPKSDEIETCTTRYLERQIQLIRPKLICTLGATALQYFTDEKSMANNHGKLSKSKNGLIVYPSYHPAAIFRNRLLKDVLDEDLGRIPSILKRIDKEIERVEEF